MKRPLVGQNVGGFYCYVQSLQTMSQGYGISNTRVFGLAVREKNFF